MSGESIELLCELDLSDMLPSMAIVPDEPRKPVALLLWRKRWKGQTPAETITVDQWSHLSDEEICLFKKARNLGQRLPWVTELGITVPLINNADDTSDCFRFGPDKVSDDRGDAVGPRARGPVKTRLIDAFDFLPNLIMNLPEEDQDGGSHTSGSDGIRRDWHATLWRKLWRRAVPSILAGFWVPTLVLLKTFYERWHGKR